MICLQRQFFHDFYSSLCLIYIEVLYLNPSLVDHPQRTQEIESLLNKWVT